MEGYGGCLFGKSLGIHRWREGCRRVVLLKAKEKDSKTLHKRGELQLFTNELGSKAPLTPVIAPPSTTSLSTEVGRCLSSPL